MVGVDVVSYAVQRAEGGGRDACGWRAADGRAGERASRRASAAPLPPPPAPSVLGFLLDGLGERSGRRSLPMLLATADRVGWRGCRISAGGGRRAGANWAGTPRTAQRAARRCGCALGAARARPLAAAGGGGGGGRAPELGGHRWPGRWMGWGQERLSGRMGGLSAGCGGVQRGAATWRPVEWAGGAAGGALMARGECGRVLGAAGFAGDGV